MKKIIISVSLVAASLLNAGVTDMLDGNSNANARNQNQTELDNLKSLERERLRKTQVKLQENSFAQTLLNNFLTEMLNKSNEKISTMIDSRIDYINMKLSGKYDKKFDELNKRYNIKIKQIETENAKNFAMFKSTLKEELKTLENIKVNLKAKQELLDKKISKLDFIFNDIKEQIKTYTTYIDSKFSLKSVKETELSRIFLLKETFPIKYIRNYNSKNNINIVLNNNKEYYINSMVTERCRVSDLSRTHIKIQCIDIKNKVYENIMKLVITSPEDDYILKSIDGKLKETNTSYPKSEEVTTGSMDLNENELMDQGNADYKQMLKVK
jgi:hypothetical protein